MTLRQRLAAAQLPQPDPRPEWVKRAAAQQLPVKVMK